MQFVEFICDNICINTLVIAVIKRITYSATDVDSRYIGSGTVFETILKTGLELKGLRRRRNGSALEKRECNIRHNNLMNLKSCQNLILFQFTAFMVLPTPEYSELAPRFYFLTISDAVE